MGTLRSATDESGRQKNKVKLGEPVIPEDGPYAGLYVWDDARFPNGTIDDDGVVTPDEVTP